MATTIFEHAAVSTMDSAGAEHTTGYVVVTEDRISAVGDGPAPDIAGARRVDATGCLITPGLINTHHHLYQWATRGWSVDADLFHWLQRLYPVWGNLTEETTHAAATAGLARLAQTGCTTVADHHYMFPKSGGDQVGALLAARERIGQRLHLVRGSMDRGESGGGLPPDDVVEDTDAALAETERTIDRHHDPEPGALVQIAIGPCSPFTATERLMAESAELARRKDVRLHTHLAETADEIEQCRAEFGATPVEYADRHGWLAGDVWLAHTVHLDKDGIARLGATGTGAAHCPTSNGRLGSGIAPVRELLDAGVPVGLGVDGAASNESCGLAEELHQALLQARQRGGAAALTARETLWMATVGGARCLGRADLLGSIEAGKLADLAVWQMDGLGHAGIDDPVTALVFGPQPQLSELLVGGKTVVQHGKLVGEDEAEIAAELRARRLR